MLALALTALFVTAPLSSAEVTALLHSIDERQWHGSDYKALAYVQAKERDKTDIVYELLVYRRDADARLMFLFVAPKAERGKGYLRIDKNLWLYDPKLGSWERRTERERLGGTDSRRGDFDASRLAEEYDGAYEGEEKLGAFEVYRLKLSAKADVDVAFPTERLWVDKASRNVLKVQEYALSGKLMRTSYYPRWKHVVGANKRESIWYPEEIRIYDELRAGSSTLILVKSVDLRPLDANLFSKAWLEAQSR